jgi:phospho-N-acetylmuramoyl-pentapeptide-transferase
MGGLAMICGITASGVCLLISSVLMGAGFSADLFACLIVAIGFGLIGFVDDYTKVAKRRNKGLTPKQKLALQIALSLAFAVYIIASDPFGLGTSVTIPFIWRNVNIGWFMAPYIVFILVAMSNAVNLTDGLDGLCAGTSGTVSIFYPVMISAAAGIWTSDIMRRVSGTIAPPDDGSGSVDVPPISAHAEADHMYYLGDPGMPGTALWLQTAFFAAIAGACLGFLVYNRRPAKIFMGDTGSLALGGAMAATAIWAKVELLLPVAGVLFVLEALSVIIQVTSYRLRHGKRVFKMAPLHHHFELSGWSEAKVVGRFTAFTVIVCAALLAVLLVQAYLAGAYTP